MLDELTRIRITRAAEAGSRRARQRQTCRHKNQQPGRFPDCRQVDLRDTPATRGYRRDVRLLHREPCGPCRLVNPANENVVRSLKVKRHNKMRGVVAC
jgi:hypothetical protein